jgi:hypothetical protein
MIVRVPKGCRTHGYTVISNLPLNDRRLSWEARGLHSWLLSKPDRWKIIVAAIQTCGPAGRDKINRMLSELEDNGYLFRKVEHGKDGRFTYQVTIYEEPPAPEAKAENRKNFAADRDSLEKEQPSAVRPLPENPGPDNPNISNTEVFIAGSLTTETGITNHSSDDGAWSEKSEHQEKSKKTHLSHSPTSDSPYSYLEPRSLDREFRRSFDDFWAIYPRKENNRKAFEEWKKLTADDRARAIADVPLRIQANWAGRNLGKIPNPSTYLRERQWTDDLTDLTKISGVPGSAPLRPDLTPGMQKIFNRHQEITTNEGRTNARDLRESQGQLAPTASGRRDHE